MPEPGARSRHPFYYSFVAWFIVAYSVPALIYRLVGGCINVSIPRERDLPRRSDPRPRPRRGESGSSSIDPGPVLGSTDKSCKHSAIVRDCQGLCTLYARTRGACIGPARLRKNRYR